MATGQAHATWQALSDAALALAAGAPRGELARLLQGGGAGQGRTPGWEFTSYAANTTGGSAASLYGAARAWQKPDGSAAGGGPGGVHVMRLDSRFDYVKRHTMYGMPCAPSDAASGDDALGDACVFHLNRALPELTNGEERLHYN